MALGRREEDVGDKPSDITVFKRFAAQFQKAYTRRGRIMALLAQHFPYSDEDPVRDGLSVHVPQVRTGVTRTVSAFA